MNRFSLALPALLLAVACSQPTPVDTTVVSTPSPTPEPSPSPTVPVTLEEPVNDLGAVDLTSSGSTVSLDMSVSEFGFDPTFIKVSPASNVTVTLTGEPDTEHTFTIDTLGVDSELASDPITTTFQLPTEGPIQFYCRFHVDQGMKGAFYFTDDDQAAPSPFPEADTGGGTGSTSGGSGSTSGGYTSSRGTSSRSGTSSQSSGPNDPDESSSGNPAVDPLDEEINEAVASDEIDQAVLDDEEPVEQEDDGAAKSEEATPADSEPGFADKSEPGAPGAPGAGGQ